MDMQLDATLLATVSTAGLDVSREIGLLATLDALRTERAAYQARMDDALRRMAASAAPDELAAAEREADLAFEAVEAAEAKIVAIGDKVGAEERAAAGEARKGERGSSQGRRGRARRKPLASLLA